MGWYEVLMTDPAPGSQLGSLSNPSPSRPWGMGKVTVRFFPQFKAALFSDALEIRSDGSPEEKGKSGTGHRVELSKVWNQSVPSFVASVKLESG